MIAWAKMHAELYPDLKLLHASGQGRLYFKAIGALRKQGLQAGIPDLHLPTARGGYIGLWIEMKRIRGSEVKPEQMEWKRALEQEGHRVAICYGADEAIGILLGYVGREQSNVLSSDIVEYPAGAFDGHSPPRGMS